MKLRVVSMLFLAALYAASLAQTKIKIVFPSEADREVWTAKAVEVGMAAERKKVGVSSFELDIPAGAEAALVHDTKTGLIFEKLVKDLGGNLVWNVTDKDARYLNELRVRVVSGDAAVGSALVKADAGKTQRQALLGPDDKGVATLSAVPLGQVKIQVVYKAAGAEKTSESKTVGVLAGSKGLEITFDLPDADRAAAAKEQAKGAAAEVTAKPVPPAGNPLGQIVNTLIGLLVIGGIGYGVYWYVKGNSDKVEAALKQAGISIPDDVPNDVPSPPQAPKRPEPIVMPDTAASQTPIIGAVANPRLVLPNGEVFLLQEGNGTLGRDAAATVPLPQFSSVSRNHATLVLSGDVLTVTDVGSSNGTYVNGSKIAGPVTVRPGDTLQLGEAVLRYEV